MNQPWHKDYTNFCKNWNTLLLLFFSDLHMKINPSCEGKKLYNFFRSKKLALYYVIQNLRVVDISEFSIET